MNKEFLENIADLKWQLQLVQDSDTRNVCGHPAYSISPEVDLVNKLNTLKMDNQFYRSSSKAIEDLYDSIRKVGKSDPYFLAQAIVWSRCLGEGMRSVSHLASVLALPYFSGAPWAKDFFSSFDKKSKTGGVIFRLDDMSTIKDIWKAYNGRALPNSMRKGFKSVIENADKNLILKYKKSIIDIANLTHPKNVSVLKSIMQGKSEKARTWETMNSESGKEVAEQVKAGKITDDEAKEALRIKKIANFSDLMNTSEFGILAALRNARNIVVLFDEDLTDKWCSYIKNEDSIKRNLTLPIYFDLAYSTLTDMDFEDDQNIIASKMKKALTEAYELAIPNLSEILKGDNVVLVDVSGSMSWFVTQYADKKLDYTCAKGTMNACRRKALLTAATIAKARPGTKIITFGTTASLERPIGENESVFDWVEYIDNSCRRDGMTNLATAFELMIEQNVKADRLFIVSDCAINNGNTISAFNNWSESLGFKTAYCIDMGAYGTSPLKHSQMAFISGYGNQMFEAVKHLEFDGTTVISEIRKIRFGKNG